MFSLRKTKQILAGNNLYMKFFISIYQFFFAMGVCCQFDLMQVSYFVMF